MRARHVQLGLGLAVAVCVAASARATLYHPELLTLSLRRPPLIDCGQGFEAALSSYFTHFAVRDGVALAKPGKPLEISVERDQQRWISRFSASSGSNTYRGIVYVEPAIEDDDDDLPPPSLPEPHQRFCSAVFGADPLTAAEKSQIEEAYRLLCRHFGVAP